MFLDSVSASLNVLAHWQTYVAALEYVAICMAPFAIIALLMQTESKVAASVGCLSMLLMPVVQVIAVSVFVLTMWPILLGLSDDASWMLPFQLLTQYPTGYVKLVAALLFAAAVLAFIPFLNRVDAAYTLLLGAVGLAFALTILESAYPGLILRKVHFWPGFWFTLGLLVVGGVMGWIGFMVSAYLLVLMDSVTKGFSQLLIFPLGASFGFVPLFIYGAWLGIQLHGGG